MSGKKKVRIIGEVGSIHDGSFGNALKAIDVLAECGVDDVKFQTHIAEAETLSSAPSPGYFKSESRYEYFSRTAFSKEQWIELAEYCGTKGVGFISSPFSIEAVDLLAEVGVDAFKVPSGEVTNLPMLQHIGETGREVILSSGMSDFRELDAAFEILSPSCAVTVLQCSSLYPCPPEKIGLNVISELKERYRCTVGLSDHSEGIGAACAAVAVGAECIEKHFTFSRDMYGSDASLAMEPEKFFMFCEEIRQVEKMLCPVDKNDLSQYQDMKQIFQKSIVASRDLLVGHVITSDNMAYKKPGDGIPANRYRDLIGKVLSQPVANNEQFKWSDFS